MNTDNDSDPWKDVEPEILRLGKFLDSFYKESDRGAILMAGSVLDEVLSSMLQAFFIDTSESKRLVNDFNAPLGTFSSRILAAYAMGLIEKQEYIEVEAIRKIRNLFGHSWDGIDFETPKVKGQIEKLPFEDQEPRKRLNHTVANLMGDWLWRERLVRNERRSFKEWSHKGGFGRKLPNN